MFPNLEKVLRVLKLTKIPVYRDSAPSGHSYPYLIYEYVNDDPNHASNSVISETLTYQITYISTGIETELTPIKDILSKNQIFHSGFKSGPYDENDETVTQFNTFVRCWDE